MTTPDPAPTGARYVYLVIYDRGGIGWAGTDEERAYEYALHTGSVVARLPVVADYRAREGLT
jgi:hypothetical protein